MLSSKNKVWRFLLPIFLFSSSAMVLMLNHVVDSQAANAQNMLNPPQTTEIRGIGILGDSNSDEYQADDHRGGKFAANTFNWMELLVARRGLNFGPWGTWDGPRRTGYKYNWALSGSDTHDMIRWAQHEGLAQQIANGEISHVFIWIGTNDFNTTNGTYQEIYEGKLSEAQIQAKVDEIIAGITKAVDTLLEAGDVQIVIATIADRSLSPNDAQKFSDPVKHQRVAKAINQVNAGIMALAEARKIGVADVSKIGAELLSRADKDGSIKVGQVPIKFVGQGDDPHYIQLGDVSGHPGTVASGLIANMVFIEPFNRYYGLNIQPLSDQEILESAGLASEANPAGCLGLLSILAPLVAILTVFKVRTK